MKQLTLETGDGKQIVAYFRPPTREEIEKITEIQKMGRLLSHTDDKEKQAEFIQAFTMASYLLGDSMIYRVTGEMPEWAEGCQRIRDVVTKYYSSDVIRIANESVQDAIASMMPMDRVQEAVTKN